MRPRRSAGDPAPLVWAVGLGPADEALMSTQVREALTHEVAFLRTGRHPAAERFKGLYTFDRHYERAATFDEVYRLIVEDLVAAATVQARSGGRVVYAVPGSPLVAESTITMLREDPRVVLEVTPAVSFCDLAWEALGVDPVAAGAHLLDGTCFDLEAVGSPGPFLVAQCWSPGVLSAIKLAFDQESKGEPRCVVLHHLGLSDRQVVEVPLFDIDKVLTPDHLTSLWIEPLERPLSSEVARLHDLARTLRASCPWDMDQTHASLARHLIEEAYEVTDAIAELGSISGSEPAPVAWSHLEEELGDVLFQVVFHCVLASEEGQFTMAQVAGAVHDKLVGRHPHVFGDVRADTKEAVVSNWEVIKRNEKGRASVTDGIPPDLPALVLAAKMQRKATALGMEVSGHRSLDALAPSYGSQPSSADLAEALYRLVALCGSLGHDAEGILRRRALIERDRIVSTERAAPPRPLQSG
ncbi:MAG: MazG nucleotide pyrophosphohydrolase domain-containing protein [Acidimicrobiales bacterium]